MRVGKELAALPGVADATVVMGTKFTSAISNPETCQGGHPNVHYTVGAAAAMVANTVEDAVGLRVKRLPITAEKVALELHGIRYDDVKGSYMGLCFAGHPESYSFRTEAARPKK
jgi:hypothetical protein